MRLLGKIRSIVAILHPHLIPVGGLIANRVDMKAHQDRCTFIACDLSNAIHAEQAVVLACHDDSSALLAQPIATRKGDAEIEILLLDPATRSATIAPTVSGVESDDRIAARYPALHHRKSLRRNDSSI